MPGYLLCLAFLRFVFSVFVFWLVGVGACFCLMASALTFRDDDHDERAIHDIALFRFCLVWFGLEFMSLISFLLHSCFSVHCFRGLIVWFVRDKFLSLGLNPFLAVPTYLSFLATSLDYIDRG
jgi:hypothetical protein